jgi:uncharacterized membrane protein (Fun14 family)
MSAEDFGNCYVNTVGGTVDGIVDLVNKMGADNVKTLVSYYSALPESVKAALGLISGYSLKRLGQWLAAVIGVEAAEVLIIFLGGVSWGILIGAFVHCIDQL